MNTPNESKRPSVAELLAEAIHLMERADVMPSPLGGCNMRAEHFMSLLYDLKCAHRELDRSETEQRETLDAAQPAQAGEAVADIHGYTLRFGLGAWIIGTGTFDGEPAVIIDDAPERGEVGAPAPDVAADVVPRARLLFPTAEQAAAVAHALTTPQPEQPASAVLTLAYELGKQWTTAMVQEDRDEAAAIAKRFDALLAQSPAVSPPSVVAPNVAVSDEDAGEIRRALANVEVHPLHHFGDVIADAYVLRKRDWTVIRAALESFASRMARGGERAKNDLSALDDPDWQEKFTAAIMGAMAYGAQRTNPPPSGHWLWQWWCLGKAQAYQEEEALNSLERFYAEAVREYERMDSFDARSKGRGAWVTQRTRELAALAAHTAGNGGGA